LFLLTLLHYSAVRLNSLPLPFFRAVAGSTAPTLFALNFALSLEFPFLALSMRI
jgi:hypothetical protein